MATMPRDITIKYKVDAAPLIAAFDTMAQQCAQAAEALRELQATYTDTCAYNTSPAGRPPEYCEQPCAEGSEYCHGHQYATGEADNSDEEYCDD